jgi:hypothetical protein
MRFASICCALLILCGWAAGQVTVVGGHAANWVPAYGIYAGPFVPLVNTPEMTLSTVSPWSAGASNRAFGMVAGATNSTLSHEFVGETPTGPITQPVWYGEAPHAGFAPPMLRGGPEGPREMNRERPEKEEAFDFISTPHQSREAAATLLAERGPAGRASRSYTNQDVERMNQTNGTFKYDGKSGHI